MVAFPAFKEDLLKREVRRRGISGRSDSGIRRVTPGKRTESLDSGSKGRFVDRDELVPMMAKLDVSFCEDGEGWLMH